MRSWRDGSPPRSRTRTTTSWPSTTSTRRDPSTSWSIPKRHITSLLDLKPEDDATSWATLVRKARDLADALGLADRGFRLVFNCGDDAGYSVYHIHLHLVGGRQLGWPPG